MNARDELAGLVNRADWTARSEKIADAILAAGWRPPARVIETIEDLRALPDSTLIRSNGRNEQFTGRVYRVKSVGIVERVGRELDGVTPFRYFVDPLPATVLYEP